jgi:CDP-diacylglycerol pyrophosphatase
VFGFYAHSASPPVIFALDGTVLDTVVTARAAAGDRYTSLAVTVSNLATASPFQHIITCTLADNDHMYGRSLTLIWNEKKD